MVTLLFYHVVCVAPQFLEHICHICFFFFFWGGGGGFVSSALELEVSVTEICQYLRIYIIANTLAHGTVTKYN